MKARSRPVQARADLAPIIAQVVLEHGPKTSGPEETIAWALSTWPGCTVEEAHRAMRIAFELHLLDVIVPAGR